MDTVDFAKIRYFRRKSIGDEQGNNVFQATTVHSLRQFQPEPIDTDDKTVTSDEALTFLKKYLKLTHCDLFFSDAAVLVEGSVEKLLLPRMIDLAAPNLNKKYLTVLEVGGAYGMRFAGLLQFLEIPYLVITDIDSVDPDNNRKNCAATVEGAVSSNATLGYFFDEKEVAALSAKNHEDCLQADGTRFIAYQKPITATIDGEACSFHGRTLEETFVYENLDRFLAGELNIGTELPNDAAELQEFVWGRIKSSTFKKTEFAMDVLAYEPPLNDADDAVEDHVEICWNVPHYIAEGLQWLDKCLSENGGDGE